MNDAGFSPCGRYRYWLTRSWIGHQGQMTFILLNPSTARANVDDPTVRRCVGFAQRERCSELAVVNLFAWRAADPRDLYPLRPPRVDPIGPENDRWILEMTAESDLIVCGWGGNGDRFPERVDAVARLLSDRQLMCLGRTSTGQPRHPLYLPSESPLSAWSPA